MTVAAKLPHNNPNVIPLPRHPMPLPPAASADGPNVAHAPSHPAESTSTTERMLSTAPTDSTPASHPDGEGDQGFTATHGKKQLAVKWGEANIEWGWVALPRIILEKQHALGLSSEDINIILQIAQYWHDPGSLPFPSKARIAKAMGVHPRTVQRRLTRLHELGFIQRIERKGGPKGTLSNQYSLAGLAERATPYAEEAIQERERQRSETAARLKRKRPKTQVKGGE
ncbi:helix-turn-helix domain-containing protein [Sorangium sp. So ce406]|uniref:helix-turn-helix domain-containing protein n=1 Tax=Sorangium sp. So ce406 TaxID=3133311 RepID=UPI003F5B9C0F